MKLVSKPLPVVQQLETSACLVRADMMPGEVLEVRLCDSTGREIALRRVFGPETRRS